MFPIAIKITLLFIKLYRDKVHANDTCSENEKKSSAKNFGLAPKIIKQVTNIRIDYSDEYLHPLVCICEFLFVV